LILNFDIDWGDEGVSETSIDVCRGLDAIGRSRILD
jgi:hypothetical protein